jgi:hypothetical protein
MIPEQLMHGAACPAGVISQVVEKVQRFTRTGPAIQDVARLHEVCPPTGPTEFFVEDPGRAQDFNELVERAVDVSHRDDSFHIIELAGRFRRPNGWGERTDRKERSSKSRGQ